MKNMIFFLILIVLIAYIAISKSIKYQYIKSQPNVYEQILTISKGDSLSSVASQLFSNKKERFIFEKLAILNKQDSNIKTGEFLIPMNPSIKRILEIITSNNTINYRITIIEGYQKYQIEHLFDGIYNAIGDMPKIEKEGIFLPDTYYYKTGDTKIEILKRANKAMENYLNSAWENRAKNLPIKNKREALILASIIEKETAIKSEYKQIASVFINRLNKGMKLQADSTSIYGITNGERKFNRKLYKGDLAKKNSYNTYYIKGLPIGPICNPSREAINAALHPADTDYLYFVANGTGGHTFANSGKEHEHNVVKWRKIRDNK